MIDRERTFFVVLLALLIYPGDNLSGAYEPQFKEPLSNLTIPLGRDALFTCHVEHLGGYKVGWVKIDTKAIQAIHMQVITHNPRVSVSHSDHSTWNLHIKGVQREDEGHYMCQINTNPMNSQVGMLSIEVPPDFIDEETSGDVSVRENWNATLTCRATGKPQPKVSWKRPDEKAIIIREPFSDKPTSSYERVKGVPRNISQYFGEQLNLTKIQRDQMGVYHCIASNGVPPSIYKRITVNVNFAPVILSSEQLVGAPLGTDVQLECSVEAFPKPINIWLDRNNNMIVSNGRYEVHNGTHIMERPRSVEKGQFSNFNYKTKMILIIRNITQADAGHYKCSAKNSHGDAESMIHLYVIEGEQVKSNVYTKNRPQETNRHPIDDRYHHTNEESSDPSERSHKDRSDELDNSVHAGSSQLSTPQTGPKLRGKRPKEQLHSSSGESSTSWAALALLAIAILYNCR